MWVKGLSEVMRPAAASAALRQPSVTGAGASIFRTSSPKNHSPACASCGSRPTSRRSAGARRLLGSVRFMLPEMSISTRTSGGGRDLPGSDRVAGGRAGSAVVDDTPASSARAGTEPRPAWIVKRMTKKTARSPDAAQVESGTTPPGFLPSAFIRATSRHAFSA